MMEDCKANGQFDVTTMGTVQNVGTFMAKKPERSMVFPPQPTIWKNLP